MEKSTTHPECKYYETNKCPLTDIITILANPNSDYSDIDRGLKEMHCEYFTPENCPEYQNITGARQLIDSLPDPYRANDHLAKIIKGLNEIAPWPKKNDK